MRRRRRALSPEELAAHSQLVARRLEHEPLFRRSTHIAAYFAGDGEIDPLPLLRRAWAMRKICYLPILSPHFHQRLAFAPYREGDPLVLNIYGIPEPARPEHLIDGRLLDLVLTPLVAFDTAGSRLGMGGGYYDRSFAFLRQRRHWRRPHLVGLAHDFQRVDQLDTQSWDVPLAAIVTEAAFYRPTEPR